MSNSLLVYFIHLFYPAMCVPLVDNTIFHNDNDYSNSLGPFLVWNLLLQPSSASLIQHSSPSSTYNKTLTRGSDLIQEPCKLIHSVVFWIMAPCSLLVFTKISEEHSDSTFRVRKVACSTEMFIATHQTMHCCNTGDNINFHCQENSWNLTSVTW